MANVTLRTGEQCAATTRSGNACNNDAIRGSVYCGPHQEREHRCGAKSKSGSICQHAVREEGQKCWMHGGSKSKSPGRRAKYIREKRDEDRAAAEASLRMKKFVDEAEPIHPAEVLLEQVRRQSGVVAYWRARVHELDLEELEWSTKTVTTETGAFNREEKVMAADAHIAYRLFQEAEDRLADYATRALRAGVEERMVQVAEGQGEMVAQVIKAVLGDLQLTAEQSQTAATVIPMRLRELTG